MEEIKHVVRQQDAAVSLTRGDLEMGLQELWKGGGGGTWGGSVESDSFTQPGSLCIFPES